MPSEEGRKGRGREGVQVVVYRGEAEAVSGYACRPPMQSSVQFCRITTAVARPSAWRTHLSIDEGSSGVSGVNGAVHAHRRRCMHHLGCPARMAGAYAPRALVFNGGDVAWRCAGTFIASATRPVIHTTNLCATPLLRCHAPRQGRSRPLRVWVATAARAMGRRRTSTRLTVFSGWVRLAAGVRNHGKRHGEGTDAHRTGVPRRAAHAAEDCFGRGGGHRTPHPCPGA